MTQQWEGRSKGPVSGYRIFIFLLKHTHLRVAYFLLYFVAFYYFAFASSRKHTYFYFRTILGYRGWKLHWSAYRNYYIFGQTLIDKFALLSGLRKKFDVVTEGRENLEQMIRNKEGAILVSAHVGSWELAGNMLNRYEVKFNVLMLDNEKKSLKEFEDRQLSEKRINVIPIDNEGMTHIVALHQAFKRGEVLVMHGDRFVQGGKTLEMDFMGHKADFPVGPYYLAARFGVPICFVGAMKTGYNEGLVFAKEPIMVERVRGDENLDARIRELMEINIRHMEETIKRFPLQWFNYYQFWKN